MREREKGRERGREREREAGEAREKKISSHYFTLLSEPLTEGREER